MNNSLQAQVYSCPDQPVRHSYPLAVKEEGFSAALNVCLKTWPFMALRFAALAGFTLAAVIWFALCFGVAALFSGKDGSGGGIILFLIAAGLPAGIFTWFKRYVLYLLKLAHVAVLTDVIVHNNAPQDLSQIAYGKKIITDRFVQTNVLFAVDSLVSGAAGAFNRTLDWVADLLPIPGLDGLMDLVHRIVNNATTYIDETIFSYNLARGDENIWRSSADGLVYYAQNVKAVLRTAVFALILEYAGTFAAFMICLIPAWLIGKMLPASISGWAWIIAVLFAMAVRSAVLRPVFLAMVALSFHVNSFGKEINLSMADLLNGASDKFVELTGKASDWVQDQAKQPAAAAAPELATEPAAG